MPLCPDAPATNDRDSVEAAVTPSGPDLWCPINEREDAYVMSWTGEFRGSHHFKLPQSLEWSDGEIRIAGHRVALTLILEAIFEGKTIEEMRVMYPTVPARKLWIVVKDCVDNIGPMKNYYSEQLAKMTTFRSEHKNESPSLSDLMKRRSEKNNK